MAEVDRILIVGGGIAGLSLATALHRQGYTPELVERSTAWPAVGAGINLPANGVRVLRALGVGEAADRTAAVVRRWGFFDQQGELLCETDLEELWRDVGPWLAITRVRLQEALLTGTAAVPHRLGVSLTALTQDDNGSGSDSATPRPATTTLWWERTASIRPCASSRRTPAHPAMLGRWPGEASYRHARQA